MNGQKIIDGLKDAIAYARGDKSRGRETKKDPWIYINKFWGCSNYIEELVRYPNNTRMVDLGVVNGNVSHGMTGFYHKDKWFSSEWNPVDKLYFREIPNGITVAAWRELKTT